VAPATVERAEAKINAVRERYEKEGWSKAKIDRALEAKYRSHSRTAQGPALDFPGAIGALLRAGSGVQVLCHSYTGRFDEEIFEVTTKITMALESVAFQRSSFPENAIVTLGPG
jgi:hypothetical protein